MCKVVLLCLVVTGAAGSYDDHMEWWEYWKLCNLAMDLMVEANRRIAQTENIRDMLAGENGWQVGTIMGKIRDKYRTMMELYRMTSNKYVHNPDITLPAMTTIKPLYYIVRMEMIHALEVEIDSLVRVLEALPSWDLQPSMKYAMAFYQEQMKDKDMEKLKPENMENPEGITDPAQIQELIKGYNKENYLRTHQRQDHVDIY